MQTRSRTVAMPSGLTLPLAFGINTRLIASHPRHCPPSPVLQPPPPPQPARPAPHGRPVVHPWSPIGASRVACAFLVYMLPPLPRCSGRAYSSLIPPSRVSLPRKGHRVGPHIDLFEACSAFPPVPAGTLARLQILTPLSEGATHFVT